MTNKKVSIIIPFYNAKKFLLRSVQSVVQQTYTSLEIILIDDGSTDGSRKILKELEAKDQRVKVFSKSNGGPSSARNLGIAKSEGGYIFFLDADDWIDPWCITNLIELATTHNAEHVIGNFSKVTNETISSGHENYFSSDAVLDQKDIIQYLDKYLERPNKFPLFAYSWGRLFKADIIKKHNIRFNESLRTFEDVELNMKYLAFVNTLCFSFQPSVYHLIHNHFLSATMAFSKNPNELFGFFQAISVLHSTFEGEIPDLEEKVDRALLSYTIIQLIRACGQLDKQNIIIIYKFTKSILKNQSIKRALVKYRPFPNESKLMPYLMKKELALGLILVGKLKASSRYKQNKGR